MCALECRRTSSARGSFAVRTRNDPPARSGVMRSCTSPFTSTAMASRNRRCPIDATTSRPGVPRGTWRGEPSGSVNVIISSCMTSLTSADLLDERNRLASEAEVQDHADDDDGKDDEPQKQSPHLAAIAARRGRRSHEKCTLPRSRRWPCFCTPEPWRWCVRSRVRPSKAILRQYPPPQVV